MSDSTTILRSASFAAHKHRNQRRKDADASPYINHPLALARVLAEEGYVGDAATLCAALLHDTICNLRDVATNPPASWPLERRREYFDWALEVIDQLRGIDAQLERVFDETYRTRP